MAAQSRKRMESILRQPDWIAADERAALETKMEERNLKRKKRSGENNGFGNCVSEPHTAATLPTVEILGPDTSLLVQQTKRLSVLFWNVGCICHCIGELLSLNLVPRDNVF